MVDTYDVCPIAATELVDSVRCRARTASFPAVAWVSWRADISDHEVAVGSWACGRKIGESREDGDEWESWSEELHFDD